MRGTQAKRLRKHVQELIVPKLPSLSQKSYFRASDGSARLVRNTVRAIVQKLEHAGVRVRLKHA